MKEKLIIRGGKPLRGTVSVSGAKNAAVAILPATILCEGECELDNLPNIDDVKLLNYLLCCMGAKTELKSNSIRVDTRNLNTYILKNDAVKLMRASYYFMGALLGRFGKAEVALPGGCAIGLRPIDQHIKGMEALGATVKTEYGCLKAEAPNGLVGTDIYLDVVSVGATINIMLAAVLAEGRTTIVNAAKEPHVVDVANFLNCMGAKVKGAGTDIVRITGVEKLHGCSYSIIPDQIETGTLMIAAAATRGDVTIQNVIPTHMEALTAKLIEMGVTVEEGAVVEDSILFFDSTVLGGTEIRRAIADTGCVMSERCRIGDAGNDLAVIGMGTVIPEGVSIRGGVTVHPKLKADAFSKKEYSRGEVVQ